MDEGRQAEDRAGHLIGRAGGQGTSLFRTLVLVPTREEQLILPLETNGL